MSIEDVLKEYTNCMFYNDQWYRLAQNNDIDSIVNIGVDFERSEMMEYAIACWQYVIDIGKGTAEAYSNLGVSYYYGNGGNQDYRKAVQYYQKAAAKGHPFGMYNLAVACENGNGTPKDFDKAVKYYRMAAEQGLNQAIDALIRLGLYDEIHGFAFYPRNLNDDSFFPTNNYKSCMDVANNKAALAVAEYGTLLGESFKDEAIEYYLKAISHKETAEAYYSLATLYKDLKEYENAIQYYEKSIQINPTHESFNDMGFCYYQNEDDVHALDYFKKSYELKPESFVLRNIGNCYNNLGEKKLAEECYFIADKSENQ